MESSRVRVLLVNQSVSDASHILEYLKNLGCLCALSRSAKEARALLLKENFDLVLSKFEVPGGDWHELPELLIGREMSFFYFYAVEGGCWWIPRVSRGQECRGKAALRPAEFAHVLKEMIADVQTSDRSIRVH